MITVAEARVAAAKRLRSRSGDWAGLLVSSGTVDEGFALGLKSPTEAQVLADRAAVLTWVGDWRAVDGAHGATVDWEHRAWSRVGGQTVPVRLRLADPAALARFAGGEAATAWRSLAERARQLRERFLRGGESDCSGDHGLGDGLAQVLRRHRAAIAGLDEAGFAQVLEAAAWLAAHPGGRMRPRQMPLRGVDSKWFARHRSLVSALHTVLTGGRVLDILDPEDRVRIRILGSGSVADMSGVVGGDAVTVDGTAALAGLTDLAAPLEQIAGLPLRPRLVLVSENLESMLALPGWDGVIAVHGSGYAVSVLERVEWLRDVPILYWGDLDSHGFAILHRLRRHLPQVTSVLMDEQTLVDHRDLWVREEKPHRGEFDTLTGQEARALARVRA
ncbi:MAG TPA: DUF2220 family protein, partial [Brevibacterium senegalense]|nr:DUF2220 family protein [Brevibacterium senegalense]